MKIRTKEKDFADEIALEAMKILLQNDPEGKIITICKKSVNIAYELLEQLSNARSNDK